MAVSEDPNRPSAGESLENFAALFFAVLLPIGGLVKGYHPWWMLLWLAIGIVLLAIMQKYDR